MKYLYVTMACVVAACAEPEPPTGKQLFANNCVACHGADGTGAGWAGSGSKRKPADLTQLSARNNGIFPLQRVLGVIDGFHRNPPFETAMPEFGSFFGGDMQTIEMDGVLTPVPGPLLAVAEYLETLQTE